MPTYKNNIFSDIRHIDPLLRWN